MSAVEIYETYGAGSCIKIQVLEPAGVWDTVWQGPKSSQSSFTTAQIFRPQLKLRAYSTRSIRLEIHTSSNAQPYEIDAVKLNGNGCTACAAGKYKASTASAPCSDCPTNTFSPAGGSALASSTSCTTITCGDGIRQGLEECDDLNTASSDGCSSTCTVEVGYFCSGAYRGGWTCLKMDL